MNHRSRIVFGLLWAAVAALLLGLMASTSTASTSTATAEQPQVSARGAYTPDARTIVAVEGDKHLGWTVVHYDRSELFIANQTVSLRNCAKLKRLPQRIRCQAKTNQRNRDYYKLQQGLAYAHALAAN